MARKRSNTKTVFITGAGGGLGGATARYLAERDWTGVRGRFRRQGAESTRRGSRRHAGAARRDRRHELRGGAPARGARLRRAGRRRELRGHPRGGLGGRDRPGHDPPRARRERDGHGAREPRAVSAGAGAQGPHRQHQLRDRLAERDALQRCLRAQQARDRGLFRRAAARADVPRRAGDQDPARAVPHRHGRQHRTELRARRAGLDATSRNCCRRSRRQRSGNRARRTIPNCWRKWCTPR